MDGKYGAIDGKYGAIDEKYWTRPDRGFSLVLGTRVGRISVASEGAICNVASSMKKLSASFTSNDHGPGESLVTQLRNRRTALRPKELALMLSVSERQVTALVKAGRLPGYKIGGCVRVDPGIVAEWLERKQTA